MNRLIIIALFGVILLISACASQNVELAGRVNGEPIPLDEFVAANRAHFENFWVQNNRAPGIDERQGINRMTWRNITKHVILKQYFSKYNIRVTPMEVLDTLRTNIPAYIRTSPLFTVNGEFDLNSYYQSLQFDKPENMAPLRKQYFDYYVPIAKLKETLIDKQLLTSKEQAIIGGILSGKADFDWVILDTNAMDVSVTDAEISSYYEKNRKQWLMTPQFGISYTLLPVKAGTADKSAALAIADSLYATLSKSDNPDLAINGFMVQYPFMVIKDSGFLKNADINPLLYTVLTSLSEGQFSAPFATDTEVAVYRLEQLTKSMTRFTSYMIPFVPLSATIEIAKSKANQVRNLASSIGISAAADEMDLELITLKDLSPDMKWLDDPAISAQIAEQLGSVKSQHVFDPIYYPGRSAWMIAQLTDNRIDRVLPLASVRDQIVTAITKDKRKEFAIMSANKWLQNSKPSTANLQGLPQVTVLKATDSNINTPLQGKIIDDVYYDAIRRHLSKQNPKAYELDNLLVIPLVNRYTPGPGKSVPAPVIRARFVKDLGADWFDKWMEDQIRIAKVRIYQYR